MQLKLNPHIPGTPPLAFQKGTHQVPKGPGSLFDCLAKRHITASQAIVLLVINYFSNWNKGLSKYLSLKTIAKCVNMSRGRVNGILRFLRGKSENARFQWLTAIKGPNRIYRYKQTYHQELPPEELELVGDISMEPKDRKFAVPYGKDSPMQMMCNGELSWQACLLWHIYRLYSDFKTTQLREPIGVVEAHQLSGLSTATVCKANQELINAGLLQRLSKGREKGFFQLFPKIRKALTGKKKKPPKSEINGMYYNDEYVYSYNRQYRMRRDNFQFEAKRKRKGWVRVSDYNRANNTYPKIIADLETAVAKLGLQQSDKTSADGRETFVENGVEYRSFFVDGVNYLFREPLLE